MLIKQIFHKAVSRNALINFQAFLLVLKTVKDFSIKCALEVLFQLKLRSKERQKSQRNFRNEFNLQLYSGFNPNKTRSKLLNKLLFLKLLSSFNTDDNIPSY